MHKCAYVWVHPCVCPQHHLFHTHTCWAYSRRAHLTSGPHYPFTSLCLPSPSSTSAAQRDVGVRQSRFQTQFSNPRLCDLRLGAPPLRASASLSVKWDISLCLLGAVEVCEAPSLCLVHTSPQCTQVLPLQPPSSSPLSPLCASVSPSVKQG